MQETRILVMSTPLRFSNLSAQCLYLPSISIIHLPWLKSSIRFLILRMVIYIPTLRLKAVKRATLILHVLQIPGLAPVPPSLLYALYLSLMNLLTRFCIQKLHPPKMVNEYLLRCVRSNVVASANKLTLMFPSVSWRHNGHKWGYQLDFCPWESDSFHPDYLASRWLVISVILKGDMVFPSDDILLSRIKNMYEVCMEEGQIICSYSLDPMLNIVQASYFLGAELRHKDAALRVHQAKVPRYRYELQIWSPQNYFSKGWYRQGLGRIE